MAHMRPKNQRALAHQLRMSMRRVRPGTALSTPVNRLYELSILMSCNVWHYSVRNGAGKGLAAGSHVLQLTCPIS